MKITAFTCVKLIRSMEAEKPHQDEDPVAFYNKESRKLDIVDTLKECLMNSNDAAKTNQKLRKIKTLRQKNNLIKIALRSVKDPEAIVKLRDERRSVIAELDKVTVERDILNGLESIEVPDKLVQDLKLANIGLEL